MLENPYQLELKRMKNKTYGSAVAINEVSRASRIFNEAVQAVIKWGEGTCPHGLGDFHDNDRPVTMCYRRDCPKCWEELKK